MTKNAILVLAYARPDFLNRRLQELSLLRGDEAEVIVSIDKYQGLEANEMSHKFELIRERFPEWRWIKNRKRFGLVKHLTTRVTEAFEEYENLVIVEDDVSISAPALSNLISAVSSPEGKIYFTTGLFGALTQPPIFQQIPNIWRRTSYFSAWGWAMNKNFWKLYDPKIVKNHGIEALSGRKSWERLNSYQKSRWSFRFSRVESDPNYTWDYQMQYLTWLHDLENKLPLWRLSDNEGFGDYRATNTRAMRPTWYQGKKSNNDLRSDYVHNLRYLDSFMNIVDSYSWIGDRKLLERMRKKGILERMRNIYERIT